MLIKIKTQEDLNRISCLFNDIRFYMGRSVLDGLMGEAYFDNVQNPKFACLLVRKYCFVSGEIMDDDLKKLVEGNFKDYFIIPSDKIEKQLLFLFENKLEITQRYSMNKNPKFNISKLRKYTNDLDNVFKLEYIDDYLENSIRQQNFITLSDNYKENGIGVCCIFNGEIIGVASSNIIYKDGIEVNIKVNERYRKKGIASAMASMLIIKCIEMGKNISWDAKTKISVKLAEKIGFKYHSTYNVFRFIK